MNPVQRLSAFYEATKPVAPSKDALDVMRLCLLDWLIVGLAAREDKTAQTIRKLATGQGPSALFFGGATHPREAALINGTITHVLDYDDTHFAHIGHVSTVVFPAALAVAQARGADFTSFLTAALLGAETATRVGLWLGRTHYQIGFHQTATSGALGAAMAAGRLLKLEDISGALSNAAGFAAGLKAQFGTAMKPVNAGMAAANGVEAALMAQAGLTGSESALDALHVTHHGSGDITAFNGIAETWLFQNVTHKFYPCCHGTHAALDALRQIIAEKGSPQHVTIHTHPRWMSVCNKLEPHGAMEAKFSYKALAALTLRHGGKPITEAMLHEPLPSTALDKIHIREAPQVSETESLVETELGTARTDLTDILPFETRLARLHEKGEGVLPNGSAFKLWKLIEAEDLCGITAAISA